MPETSRKQDTEKPSQTPAVTRQTPIPAALPSPETGCLDLNTSLVSSVLPQKKEVETKLEKGRFETLKKTLQTVQEVFSYLPLSLKIKTAVNAAINTLTMSQGLLAAYFTKCLIDKMGSSPGVLPSKELALVVGSGFLFAVGRYFTDLLADKTRNEVDNALEDVFMQGIAKQPLMVVKGSEFQGKLESARNFYEVTGVIDKGFSLVSGGTQILIAATAMSSIHWGVTLGVLASCIPSLWASIKQVKQQIVLIEENQKLWPAFGARRHYFLDPAGFKELVLMNKQVEMAKRISDDNILLNDRSYRISKSFAGYSLISNFSTEIGVGLAMLYTVFRASQGSASVGDLTLVTSAASALIYSVSGVARSISEYAKNIYTAGLFKEVVTPVPGARTSDALTIMEQTPRIEVDVKEFGYPPEGEKGDYKSVLRDIKFEIEPGKFVAIVGKNGQGKSSLINILTGVYEPLVGSIKIDGKNLSEFSVGQWYPNIGVLDQDFRLIASLSIRENIAMGEKPGKESLTVEQAAEMAGLNTFLSGLSQGLDAIFGQGAGGADFSGGEKQKIALARALVSMPKVLFLDEPTASIDKAAEKKLFDTIEELRRTRGWNPTIVYISHTFARVSKADKIIVMNGGEIEDTGTHDELMKKSDGTYATLFRLDAEAYK